MPAKAQKASKPNAAKAGGAINIKPLSEAVLDQLHAYLKKSGLNEIEIKQGDASVRISRSSGPAKAGIASAAPEASPVPAAPANTFNAPMIGTFYRGASPEAAAFVKVGDTVRAGQVLCIIEAMKTMNQIEADRAGKVLKIMLEDATPVEYGQPLFVIE